MVVLMMFCIPDSLNGVYDALVLGKVYTIFYSEDVWKATGKLAKKVVTENTCEKF